MENNENTGSRATRCSWQNLRWPVERQHFDLPMHFNNAEAERLQQGLIPDDMNDRWFIFFEEGWLFFHRSWTGDCIFGVRLDETPDGGRVLDAWSSRDDDRYKSPGLDDEKRLVADLITMCLR